VTDQGFDPTTANAALDALRRASAVLQWAHDNRQRMGALVNQSWTGKYNDDFRVTYTYLLQTGQGLLDDMSQMARQIGHDIDRAVGVDHPGRF